MNRSVAVAAIVVVSLAMLGCSAPQDQPAEQPAQEQQENTPTKKEQAAEYVAELGADTFGEIGDGIDAIIEAINTDDKEAAWAAAADVEKKCNRIIDMTEVPEIAERPHGHVVEAAAAYKEAAISYAMVPKLKNDGRIDDAAQYLNEGNESINKAMDALEMAADAIEDMNRQSENAENRS